MINAVALESAMTAQAVLSRLARHGFWLDPNQPDAAEWIRQCASRARLPPDEMARRLSKDSSTVAVAIRRQWFANVLWYSRSVLEVLTRCTHANPAQPLLDVLNLHEPDSRPTVPLEAAAGAPHDSVILDGDQPVGVGPREMGVPSPAGRAERRTRGSGTPGAPMAAPDAARVTARAWPRIDAPDYTPAITPFDVIVGFGKQAQSGVAGAELVLDVPAGVARIPMTVVLTATGIDAPDGWSKPLDVEVANVTAAQARFVLVGRTPQGPEPVHLTTLEARYVRDGAIIGSASRPIVIGPPTMTTLNTPEGRGMAWLAQPPAGTAVDLQPVTQADLTIELAKPDRNAATGIYSCLLHSPHTLSVSAGPYDVDLGQDAKTFAKTVVDQVRQLSSHDIVSNLLESVGDVVAERLPAEAMIALTEVARLVAPDPPAVLIVSADPYVPWELARMPVPIDPSRPAYLGAQVLLGRWLQDRQARVRPDGHPRPPVQPPSTLSVKHIAVMAGQYRAESGLRTLPSAEQEAQTIVATYNGVPLAASLSSLKRLLDADLEHQSERIGGADAVHFAGHGEFDPSKQDSSVLFLSDGAALSSILFRSAKYGGAQQPLLFLNACMIGIGGQLLGDLGGFPGNCLKGGFGGVLGALWEVDDGTAGTIAVDFWKRAMAGEPVGAILRDLRARYVTGSGAPPESTYLAYVYYGHPRLTLQRSV